MKSVLKYYTQHHSPVYTCILDASKAFDKINHFKLFRKLLGIKTSIVIVSTSINMKTRTPTPCVKWSRCISDCFSISNGVRQGRILSPKLFFVYVDDLCNKLVKSKVGCSIDNLVMNHVMYADDICFMAPSRSSCFIGIN